MSALDIDVSEVIGPILQGLDNDLLEYVISVVDGMTVNERKNHLVLSEVITPFLVDSGFVSTENESEELCKKLSILFGGSGYAKSTMCNPEDEEAPSLLSAPVRMIGNFQQYNNFIA